MKALPCGEAKALAVHKFVLAIASSIVSVWVICVEEPNLEPKMLRMIMIIDTNDDADDEDVDEGHRESGRAHRCPATELGRINRTSSRSNFSSGLSADGREPQLV